MGISFTELFVLLYEFSLKLKIQDTDIFVTICLRDLTMNTLSSIKFLNEVMLIWDSLQVSTYFRFILEVIIEYISLLNLTIQNFILLTESRPDKIETLLKFLI